jgi:hypothetical protein
MTTTPATAPKNPAAVALGRLGGQVGGLVRSRAKARAARANGKLGGRPKKATQDTAATQAAPTFPPTS